MKENFRKLLAAKKDFLQQYRALSRFLISKGILRSIAEDIASKSLKENDPIVELKRELQSRIITAPPLTLPAKIALVGPTGVGKTTTIKKLEAHYQKSLELTLIDTPGCNFYEPGRVEEIGESLKDLPDVKILLTLSAATKDVDLYGAIHQFSSLPLSGLIFTKLDETLALGVLLNVSVKTSLPLFYITYGYPLPGCIEIADSERITHKIMTDHNSQEFHFLRQLIME